MRPLWGLLGWLLAVSPALAHSVPPDRLQTLAKGASMTTVFERQGDFNLDLRWLQAAGFRHVRIFVDADQLDDVPYRAKLDRLMDEATDRSLGVILTMISKQHPWTDKTDVEPIWTAAWQVLTERYRPLSPELVFPEIANEPSIRDRQRWRAIQSRWVSRMRNVWPKHTLLLTGSPDQMVWSLPSPDADQNVVYTWHLYQPMIFTHQGAEWEDPPYRDQHGLMYPPDPANIRAVGRPEASKLLAQYAREGQQMMWREIAESERWASRYHAAMQVSEFGAYTGAPLSSRANWLRDARTRIERSGAGWTVWEYKGGFDITDPTLLAALGMR